MKLRDAIEKRTDVKRYDWKVPDWRKVVRAIDAARFGTSAGNHFATRFILVSDEAVIAELSGASQQAFVGKAKSVVVVVSDSSSLVRSYGDSGDKYCRLQAGVAIQNFLLALEEEKLVTSWVWYFADEQIKRLLDIPEEANIEGIFPIGNKPKAVSHEKKRGVRLENIMFFGKYGTKKMSPNVIVGRDAI